MSVFLHRKVKKAASNVFQITLWNEKREDRPSFFVLNETSTTAFVGDCAYTADARGVIHLFAERADGVDRRLEVRLNNAPVTAPEYTGKEICVTL